MANLETLELTINGTAQGATQSIDTLITRLSFLSTEIGKSVSGLMHLNAQLAKTRRIASTIRFPNVSNLTNASNAVASARGGNGKGYQLPKETISAADSLKMVNESSKQELLTMKTQGQIAELINKGINGELSSKQIAERVLQIQKETDQIEKLNNAEKELNERTKETPSALAQVKEGFKNMASGVTSVFSKIKRIATTMLIRSAIRGLIKSLKEGITNVREWAKVNNHEFYDSMNNLKKTTNQLKNSLGASFAPLISALIPLMQSLCNIIIDAANAFNQFISLLTGKGSWIKATGNVDGYTDSVNKAGSAAKEWLATFDELNVMTSSSGGGGGSSSTDYTDMFEEITAFDSDIRELVEFIKENMETIKTIAVGIGIAILEWKFGNAFLEAMPVLSSIMGYIGTGAAIAVTIGLEWMFANEYLQTGKEGWLWAEVLTGAVGAIAAWGIANKLIGGAAGAWAATITLSFTAITGIVANITNTDVSAFSAESLKQNIVDSLMMGGAVGIGLKMLAGVSGGWALVAAGGAALLTFGITLGLKLLTEKSNIEVDSSLITLTEEQCDEYVQSRMFTIRPSVVINLIESNISVSESAREAVTDSLTSALGTINVIKLGLANSNDYAYIKEQITGKGGLIDRVSTWINSAEETSKLVLKLTPKIVGETPEEQNQWYLDNIEGWELVKGFMNDIGKQLVDEIVVGEQGELIIKRPERVAALLDEAARISEIIAGTDVSTELNIDFAFKLENYDSSSIGQVIADFYEYKENMKKAAEELQKTAYANQARLVEALKYMLTLDPDNEEIKQKLAEAEAGLEKIKKNWKEGVEAAVDEMTAPGRQILQEWINNNIMTEYEPGSIDFPVDFNVQLRMEGEIATKFQNIMQGEIDNAVDAMQYAFRTAGIDVPTQFIGDFLKFGGWDLLGEDLQQKIMSYVNITPDTVEELKNKLGMDASQIIKFTNWDEVTNITEFIQAIQKAYGPESIKALKDKFPTISASLMFQIDNWNSWSAKTQLEFLNEMKKIYGADEVLRVAKEKGVDIGAAVAEGMDSSDPEIKAVAEEWSKIIKDGTESTPPKVKPQMDGKATDKAKTDINTRMGTVTPPVEVKETVKKTTETTKNVTKRIGTFKPAVIATEDTKKTAATRGSVSKHLGSFRQSVVPVESEKSTEYTRGQVSKHLGSFRQDVIAVESKKSTEYTRGAINKNIGTFKPAVKTVENVSATKATRKSTNTNLGTFEPYVKAKESAAATKAARKSVNTNIGTFTPSVVAKESVKSTQYTKGQITKGIGTFTPAVKAAEDLKKTAATRTSMTKGIGTFAPLVSASENKSKTSSTRNSIESGIGTINAYIEAKEKAGKAKAVKDSISDTVGTVNSYVYPYKNVDQANRTKNLLNDQYSTINAYVYAKKDDTSANQAKASIQSTFSGMTASVSVSATLSNSTAFRNSVKGSLSGIRLSVKDGNGTTKQFATIAAAQNGGLFDSGDLFFANENGNAEMIGRFGNQTGVANQREIVAGIQKGVADANAEQNALLQKQNELLYGILQKCGVQFGASASLGRVVNQSLEMYSALVGG